MERIKNGGLNLQKWRSSILTIVKELSEEQQIIPVDSEDDVKVLDIIWSIKQTDIISEYYQ